MTTWATTYTAAQVRAAEAPLLAAGVPLMLRASAALAEELRRELTEVHAPRVLVLAGSGDNGADALFAAAELVSQSAATVMADADPFAPVQTADRAIAVDVLLVSERFHVAALTEAVSAGARRIDLARLRDSAASYDLVVDGILGIGAGAKSALRGSAREAVQALLHAARTGALRVVAVDLPSGIHPDTGEADEVVLPAAVTVTFGAVKAGLAIDRGPELSGDIVFVDLGLTPGLRAEAPAGEAEIARVVRA
ncbi:NAD(P)H-hydrate epimerase [Microbacterium sp. R86528]|uniref:NAD(P)H-hydrate epimerase n=1 Tax=Microbacterium sp. R86528 TaxID=3093864 RepID=UPI0037CB8C20